jgi:hypothetical protein
MVVIVVADSLLDVQYAPPTDRPSPLMSPIAHRHTVRIHEVGLPREPTCGVAQIHTVRYLRH